MYGSTLQSIIGPYKHYRKKDNMAETSSRVNSPLADSTQTYEKLLELLKTKDDTSRFVGLALLKTVLDNGQLVQDTELIHEIWESISPKFIKRLLRA